MLSSDFRWINGAISSIEKGVTRRMDKPDGRIVVYKTKNVIRVDIKKAGGKNE